MAVRLTSPKSRSASSDRVERSRPTIAPTKALTSTSSANCRQLARSPSAGPGTAAGAGGGRLQRRRLGGHGRPRPLSRRPGAPAPGRG